MATVRAPAQEVAWLDAWAKGRGDSRASAFVALIRASKGEGTPAQKVMVAEANLERSQLAVKRLAEQLTKAMRAIEQLQATNKGLRSREAARTKRIKARVPKLYWGLILEDGYLEIENA